MNRDHNAKPESSEVQLSDVLFYQCLSIQATVDMIKNICIFIREHHGQPVVSESSYKARWKSCSVQVKKF